LDDHAAAGPRGLDPDDAHRTTGISPLLARRRILASHADPRRSTQAREHRVKVSTPASYMSIRKKLARDVVEVRGHRRRCCRSRKPRGGRLIEGASPEDYDTDANGIIVDCGRAKVPAPNWSACTSTSWAGIIFHGRATLHQECRTLQDTGTGHGGQLLPLPR